MTLCHSSSSLSFIARASSRRSFATSARTAKRYGFIGLGRMGAPMAANLAKSLNSNDSLLVYDAFQPALDSFTSSCSSSKVSSSAQECAENSDVIVTSLPNTSHVQSVYEPFLSSSQIDSMKGKLCIDTSTISPAATKKLHDGLREKGVTLLDAPVSGGVVGAQAATLTFMISLPPSANQQEVEGILKSMGKKIIVCGDYPGAGLAAKLANNYALALNNIATCDAMLLGLKLGLDSKVLANVLNTSTGRSWPSEINNPVPGVLEKSPSSKGYEGGFGVALMRKDLELALQAEKDAAIVAGDNKLGGTLSKLSQNALELYKTVEATEQYSKKDFSVVYQYLQDQ